MASKKGIQNYAQYIRVLEIALEIRAAGLWELILKTVPGMWLN
jgi:hypothetical protein